MAWNRKKDEETAVIFSIQHFCLQDGPGIRSLIFFKGCPLRCVWCQNPESWRMDPEPAFKAHLCMNCRTCIAACPGGVLLQPDRRKKDQCRRCFTCVHACPCGAQSRFGELHSTDSILKELRPEYPYFRDSGGGVTFSGGEATLSAAFAADIAERLKAEGVHLTLETCGQFSLDTETATDGDPLVQRLLMAMDLILYDIKLFDDETHQRYCGGSNQRIKANLAALARSGGQKSRPLVWPRLPIIPGITDTWDNLGSWADFLMDLGLKHITIVPYHRLGNAKRAWLGLAPGPEFTEPSPEALQAITRFLEQKGLNCYTPGEEEWRN